MSGVDMSCAEFHRALPELMENDIHDLENEEHFRSCKACSSLVADLNSITEQAPLLQASDEPSPRVWNSIEMQLRQEGLIRTPGASVQAARRSWSWWARLAPVAAALLVGFGISQFKSGNVRKPEVAKQFSSGTEFAGSLMPEDREVLDLVAPRSPAVRAQYAVELENVDSYIRDAQQSAKNDPNDEDSQQYLMDAYQQKAMVYQMALDRSLQ